MRRLQKDNAYLILDIQSAGVKRGCNGFRKNKPTDKNPESEDNLFEHLTVGKDVFNMINISCENFPLHDFRPISVGG